MNPQLRLGEEAKREDMGKGWQSSNTCMFIHTCKMQQLPHKQFCKRINQIKLQNFKAKHTPHVHTTSEHRQYKSLSFTRNRKELNRETKRRGRERRATFDTNHYTQSLTKPLKHWLEAMCILAVQSQPHKKVFIWMCAYSFVCVFKNV